MPVDPSLTRAQIDALRTHHVAFAHASLAGAGAKELWRKAVSSAYEAAMGAKVGDLVDADALCDALDHALSREGVDREGVAAARDQAPAGGTRQGVVVFRPRSEGEARRVARAAEPLAREARGGDHGARRDGGVDARRALRRDQGVQRAGEPVL